MLPTEASTRDVRRCAESHDLITVLYTVPPFGPDPGNGLNIFFCFILFCLTSHLRSHSVFLYVLTDTNHPLSCCLVYPRFTILYTHQKVPTVDFFNTARRVNA